MNLWILDDLDDDLINDGMAEIIKVSCVLNKDSFTILKNNNTRSLKSNKK